MQKRAYDFILWAVFVSMAGAAFMAVVGVATVAPFLMRPARFAVFSQNPLAVVTPQPTPSPSDGGWQTYRDGKLGIELEYPAGWEVEKESTVSSWGSIYSSLWYNPNANSNEDPDPYMSDQGDAGITIFLFPNIPQDLNAWYASVGLTEEKLAGVIEFMNSEAGESFVSREDISFQGSIAVEVAGLPAVAEYIKSSKPLNLEGGGKTVKKYYVKVGDKGYRIEVTTPTGERADEMVALFDRVVASIRFTQ